MKVKVWTSWSYGRSLWCFLFGHVIHGRGNEVPTATKVEQWNIGTYKGIETPVFIKCDRCECDIRTLHLVERDKDLDIM